MGLAGATVPVTGVARIALDPVHMGVDPGAVGIVGGLGEAMGGVPLAPGEVPQRLECRAGGGGRRGPRLGGSVAAVGDLSRVGAAVGGAARV